MVGRYQRGDALQRDGASLRVSQSQQGRKRDLIDYDFQYQYCLNISFNEDGTPGRGSAIFLRCFGPTKPYTGGCVALPWNKMKLVMQKVKKECVVVIGTLDSLKAEL